MVGFEGVAAAKVLSQFCRSKWEPGVPSAVMVSAYGVVIGVW